MIAIWIALTGRGEVVLNLCDLSNLTFPFLIYVLSKVYR